jgi:hypothetical protein
MIIENDLDVDFSGFHLKALSSGLPFNVDLDTSLTVAAGNWYPSWRELSRYEFATPDRIRRHFLDNTGSVTVVEDQVRVDLALRTCTPVLIDAGFPQTRNPDPVVGRTQAALRLPATLTSDVSARRELSPRESRLVGECDVDDQMGLRRLKHRVLGAAAGRYSNR